MSVNREENINAESDIVRAEVLREAGRWHEAVDLARSIATEQPDRADAWAFLALVLPQLKMLDEAEHAAHKALELDPHNPVAFRALAVIRMRQQRVKEAVVLAEEALTHMPNCPEILMILGIARMAEQRLDEADALFLRAIDIAQLAEAHANRALLQLRRNDMQAAIFHGEAAVAKKPFLANAWQLLARLYQQTGRWQKAVDAFEQVVRLEPDNAMAVAALGESCRLSGNLAKAIEVLQYAAEKFPHIAILWTNLGLTHQSAGSVSDAQICYEKALALDPNLGEVHHNLGALYQQAGNLIRAQSAFDAACRCLPERADFHANRGIVLWQAGDFTAALEAIKRSLCIKELSAAKGVFVRCVQSLGNIPDDSENRVLIVRAMSEPWGRPRNLAAASINLLKSNRTIRESVGRAMLAWPRRINTRELFENDDFRELSAHPVLRCLMETSSIPDPGLEQFLTTVRKNLLASVSGDAEESLPDDVAMGFYCSLACQCFINDYVFSLEAVEIEKAVLLRDEVSAAIRSCSDIPAINLVALATYFPLYTLPGAELLLQRVWPDAVSAVLRIQIKELLEEHRYRNDIKQLTIIEDEVSMQVQQQYEDNPYPRWTQLPMTESSFGIDDYLRKLFPMVPFRPSGVGGQASILVAGCGTGQHSIETAQRFRSSRVLAVDLSMTSLGYAVRKTHELGLDNIEYAQADIMALGSSNLKFDVIESVGVLHHLKDPLAGWEILCSLLKPGGFMRLGLYSELARKDIAAAKHFIAQRGYGASASDIRRCRQEVIALTDSEKAKQVTRHHDFFATSSCRDLLFHCQEHLFTLPQIQQILKLLDLELIGFISETPSVGFSYRSRFPDDSQMTNLDFWSRFEADNSDTFQSMYQFWVQKCS